MKNLTIDSFDYDSEYYVQWYREYGLAFVWRIADETEIDITAVLEHNNVQYVRSEELFEELGLPRDADRLLFDKLANDYNLKDLLDLFKANLI